MKKLKCICDEMAAKVMIFESRAFKCPQHGSITIDRRSVTAPYSPGQPLPSVPYTAPSIPYQRPYTGDPPGWFGTTGTATYISKPTDQITYTS